jgi:hypothetical protein
MSEPLESEMSDTISKRGSYALLFPEEDHEAVQIHNEGTEEVAKKCGMLAENVGFEQDSNSYMVFITLQFFDSLAASNERESTVDRGKLARSTYSFVSAMFLYSLVIFTQLVVTGFMMISAEELETDMEDPYFLKYYNVSVLGAGKLLRQAVADGKPITEKSLKSLGCISGPGENIICRCHDQLRVHSGMMYCIIIGVWIVFVVGEMKMAFWATVHYCGAKVHTRGVQLKVHQEHPEDVKEIFVVTLSRGMKVLLILIDPLTRFIIAVGLCYAGSKFLILQTHSTTIVLKVLTMRFVVQVDEYLLNTIVTRSSTKELKKARLMTRFGRPQRTNWWENGLGQAFWLFCSLTIMYLIIAVAFHKLDDFRNNCRIYRDAFPKGPLGDRPTFMKVIDDFNS